MSVHQVRLVTSVLMGLWAVHRGTVKHIPFVWIHPELLHLCVQETISKLSHFRSAGCPLGLMSLQVGSGMTCEQGHPILLAPWKFTLPWQRTPSVPVPDFPMGSQWAPQDTMVWTACFLNVLGFPLLMSASFFSVVHCQHLSDLPLIAMERFPFYEVGQVLGLSAQLMCLLCCRVFCCVVLLCLVCPIAAIWLAQVWRELIPSVSVIPQNAQHPSPRGWSSKPKGQQPRRHACGLTWSFYSPIRTSPNSAVNWYLEYRQRWGSKFTDWEASCVHLRAGVDKLAELGSTGKPSWAGGRGGAQTITQQDVFSGGPTGTLEKKCFASWFNGFVTDRRLHWSQGSSATRSSGPLGLLLGQKVGHWHKPHYNKSRFLTTRLYVVQHHPYGQRWETHWPAPNQIT